MPIPAFRMGPDGLCADDATIVATTAIMMAVDGIRSMTRTSDLFETQKTNDGPGLRHPDQCRPAVSQSRHPRIQSQARNVFDSQRGVNAYPRWRLADRGERLGPGGDRHNERFLGWGLSIFVSLRVALIALKLVPQIANA